MKIKHFIEEKMLIVEITEDLDHHESEKIRSEIPEVKEVINVE